MKIIDMNRFYATVLAFGAIYLVWGSTYLAILFALETMPPLLMSGFRFLAAGILLYGWCLIKGEKMPDFSSFYKNAISGILMLGGGTFSVVWAEQYISSSLAAIIVTTVPFWFVVLDRKQWTYYFSNKQIITGLLVGFTGVMLLIGFNESELHKNSYKQWLGILVLIAGGIAWVSGSLYSKYKHTNSPVIVNATIQLLVAGMVCLLASVLSQESKNFYFGNVSANSFWAVAYLVVFGSLITYLCYLWLLKTQSTVQVSTYVYVNPVVALLLGVLIAGERMSTVQIFAFIVILAGVYMVNRAKASGSIRKLVLN